MGLALKGLTSWGGWFVVVLMDTSLTSQNAEAYSEPEETPAIELFAKIGHNWKLLTIFVDISLHLRYLIGFWIRL